MQAMKPTKAIQDSGPGRKLERLDRLFDAFYTTKADGMGIGLPVSRSIMERHGGRLWATRNDGPGATFWLSIPNEAQNILATPSPTDQHQGVMVG